MQDHLELSEIFEFVHNFRDFGGYAADGGRVKKGQLYRSAHYADASTSDLEAFAKIGMAAIVDLRRPGERFRLPTRRAEGCQAKLIAYGVPSDEIQPPHLAFLSDPDVNEDMIVERMCGIYVNFPYEPGHIQVFSDAFATLAEVNGPIVIHCHAGKDRTGVLCALIHHVLGVSRDDTYQDYLLTNDLSRIEKRLPEIARLFAEAQGRAAPQHILRMILGVKAAYLDSAFASIDRQDGSIDSYLQNKLKVTPAMRDAIKTRLIEAV